MAMKIYWVTCSGLKRVILAINIKLQVNCFCVKFNITYLLTGLSGWGVNSSLSQNKYN